MINRRTLALTPLALLFVAREAHAEPELSFALDMSGPRPALAMSLNGGAAEAWVFDTGAGGSVISIERAQALGLPNQGEARLGSPAGGTPVSGFRTTISGARVGDTALPEFRAVAAPMPAQLNHTGVLSPNAFSGRLVRLEFAHGMVRVRDRDAAPAGTPTPYTGQRPLPGMTVSVGAQSYEAHLDSGAPHLVSFPYALAPSLPLAAPPTQVGVARFVDGEHARYAARITGTVQIGPLTVTDPEISMIDGLPFVNVGMEALRRMVVTLDPEQRVSWVELA